MMGGATLYRDGIVFAVVGSDGLWFKAEAERFTYPRKDGKVASMNDRRAPSDCYDDPDALRGWVAHALAAGRRLAK